MKELSIEEKAKCYDEAIKRAENFIENGDEIERTIAESIFAVIREVSKDEKIRKAIGYAIGQSTHSDGTLINGVSSEEALAWLEKQCEHTNFYNKIQIGDKVTRNEDGVLVNLSQLNRVAKPSEKQGEQKPYASETMNEKRDFDRGFTRMMENEQKSADKIEPKFKVGDKITKNSGKSCPVHRTTDDTICEVAEVHDTCYILNTKEGRIQEPFKWQDYYELVEQNPWSEEDEKMLKDTIRFCELCGNQISANWLKSLKERVQPQLKQEWSEEDEHMFNAIINSLDREKLERTWKTTDDVIGVWLNSLKNRLYLQHNQGWSEGDDNHFRMCLNIMCGSEGEYAQYLKQEAIDWFKSLKERVQPQLKQAWSEEDEEMLNHIICDIESLKEQVYCKTLCNEEIDWLKSLRPQSQWRPSDEQIGVIEAVINNRSFQRRYLDSLYADLKKLREA